MTAGVPTVWMAVLQALQKEPERWDLSALQRMVVGGSAVPRSLLEGFDRLGLTIIQAWGMTETSPLGTRGPAARSSSTMRPQTSSTPIAPARAGPRRWSSFACAATTANSWSGTTKPWASSRSAGRGWRRPITAAPGAEKFTDDGWFTTGDVVRIDQTGCIRIMDRSKDLVKSGGEWISSVDLENLADGPRGGGRGGGDRDPRREVGRAPARRRRLSRRQGGDAPTSCASTSAASSPNGSCPSASRSSTRSRAPPRASSRSSCCASSSWRRRSRPIRGGELAGKFRRRLV